MFRLIISFFTIIVVAQLMLARARARYKQGTPPFLLLPVVPQSVHFCQI